MKPTKIFGILGLLGVSVLGCSVAMADDSGMYAGVGVGRAKSNFNSTGIATSLGTTATTTSESRWDNAYKLFGGYKFNPNFALEGGYFDLGKSGFSANTPGGPLNGSLKVSGWNLDALGILPMSDNFSIFGRLGLQNARTKDSFSGAGVINTGPTRNETNYKAGLGVQYDFNQSVGLRGEWERYRISDAVSGRSNMNVYSVSLVFPFGRKPEPTHVAEAPAPEPVSAPAAPVVVARAPVAPPPVPEKITLSADSLFDFNKADVKPEGKQSLDTLAYDLKSTNFNAVSVTGYTDRIGSNEANMELSLRRAESVKQYLVDDGGIEAAKIFTSGKGEADPVTQPGECKGNKKTKALIKCLQPDRRVVVEVSGTKQ